MLQISLKVLLIYLVIVLATVKGSVPLETQRPAFDPEIYENALDSELCREQIRHIRSNLLLRLQFLDAGLRFPRGIFQFNFVDMGIYDQCLEIYDDIGSSVIEGKYCRIRGPIDDNFAKIAASMNWEFDPTLLNETNLNKMKDFEYVKTQLQASTIGQDRQRSIPVVPPELTFTLALCIPKTCTMLEGMRGLYLNLTLVGARYEEVYCRFKDDKPWVPGDYVAITIFSLIGLLTIISTSYDIYNTFMIKKDPKSINNLYRSFSVYTNAKRLTTFTSSPSNLNCVDGIRAISMFWIVVGHTYTLFYMVAISNVIDLLEWITSARATWIIAAPYSVDTFFLLSGMLVVYTTVGKLSGAKLLKNLHLFYLNRLLRMFPLLASIVLLQATLFHHLADGPDWQNNVINTENCRDYWWSTLLYVQNFVNVERQCINHSWYLAIDTHCYILCPIILYWVLSGKKKQAWISLIGSLLVSLTIAATYCFIMQFQGWITGQIREGGDPNYHYKYYYNTIPRNSPFFVGMIFGYILSIWKGQRPQIPRYIVGLFWILSGGIMLLLMYVIYLLTDSSWEYWIVDDLVNSFARPLWTVCVGWIIFACQHGYGGPVNWLLSLDIWKLPSRISFGLYLFHFHLQYVLYGTIRTPQLFSESFLIYNFFAQVTISYGVAFAVTVLIDSPCSVLIKQILGNGPKKPPANKENADKKY